MSKYVSKEQVAKMLNVKPRTVAWWGQRGLLEREKGKHKDGKGCRPFVYSLESVERFKGERAPNGEDWIPLVEACNWLEKSKSTIVVMCNEGELECRKAPRSMGGKRGWFVSTDSIREWLNRPRLTKWQVEAMELLERDDLSDEEQTVLQHRVRGGTLRHIADLIGKKSGSVDHIIRKVKARQD